MTYVSSSEPHRVDRRRLPRQQKQSERIAAVPLPLRLKRSSMLQMSLTRFPQQIGGFEILGSLGQGGMGIVYCARDNLLQRELAIKLLSGDWKDNPDALERFLREARILAQINHPHVVQIYSVGEHEGVPYFVMELLDGSIADAVRLKSPTVDQAKRWMLEAARGLAAIHEMGVVHRDVKPGNLLLTHATSVEPEHVKVADLGIARTSSDFGAPLTRVGVVLGTGGYLAPEAFRRERPLDSRADQYSLGVVFFELLARRAPQVDRNAATALLELAHQVRNAPDVREFRPEVDSATATVLARMLEQDPDRRFPSTAALVQALTQVQGGPAALAEPGLPRTKVEEKPDSGRTSRVRAVITDRIAADPVGVSFAAKAVAIGLLLLVIGIGGSYWQSSDPRGPDAPEQTGRRRGADQQQTIDALHREAWAKYLVAHYQLRAKPDEVWSLDLVDQSAGVLSAELKGAEDETVELTGRVEAQETRVIDGVSWDSYTLTLLGAGGRVVEWRVEFSEDEEVTRGEGIYRRAGAQRSFTVEDSEDFPE